MGHDKYSSWKRPSDFEWLIFGLLRSDSRVPHASVDVFLSFWTDFIHRMPQGIFGLFADGALAFEPEDSLDRGVPTALCKTSAALGSCTWLTVERAHEMIAKNEVDILKCTHGIGQRREWERGVFDSFHRELGSGRALLQRKFALYSGEMMVYAAAVTCYRLNLRDDPTRKLSV